MKKTALPIAALVILIVLAIVFANNPNLTGNTDPDSSQNAGGSQSAPAPKFDPSLAKVPDTTTVAGKTVPLTTSADGVKYYDVTVGAGAAAAPGESASLQYTGSLLNGTTFDSTAKHGGTPFTFGLGHGQVIKGWDDGIPGMKVGGERILVIPGFLAYGASPPPGAQIPPNATLVFDVKLVSVK